MYRFMNILLKHTEFNKNAIQFLETKPNMLFDGLFTKLNYCDDFMVMYGIYLDVPVETGVRPIIASDVLTQFELIERELINEYIEHRELSNKIITNKFSDFVRSKYDIRDSCSGESLAVLKISGIWENTNGEIGLSFKLLQR